MAEELQPRSQPREVVDQKQSKNIQPCDATFYARNKDKAAHNGLVGANEHNPRRDNTQLRRAPTKFDYVKTLC
jgi:hypothetical protein